MRATVPGRPNDSKVGTTREIRVSRYSGDRQVVVSIGSGAGAPDRASAVLSAPRARVLASFLLNAANEADEERRRYERSRAAR